MVDDLSEPHTVSQMETVGILRIIWMLLCLVEVERLSVRSRIRKGTGLVVVDCVIDYIYLILLVGESYICGPLIIGLVVWLMLLPSTSCRKIWYSHSDCLRKSHRTFLVGNKLWAEINCHFLKESIMCHPWLVRSLLFLLKHCDWSDRLQSQPIPTVMIVSRQPQPSMMDV